MAERFFLLIGGVLTMLLVMWHWFRVERKRDWKRHQAFCEQLETKLALHRKQIAKRHIALRRYDFLEYNLEEALLVQQEIK
ncbi:hypothetical protein [Altibacter sp. HG106]|uniref:hypothetical protein n=1 Tax=Altibacter sp. HG106 TaxID=3023937 RepID=UPI00235067BC|nr:hypothetical protein [Altibacter sp. HG106]MDC7994364.1 hypothetical protein [Altibacter sp. HG106]